MKNQKYAILWLHGISSAVIIVGMYFALFGTVAEEVDKSMVLPSGLLLALLGIFMNLLLLGRERIFRAIWFVWDNLLAIIGIVAMIAGILIELHSWMELGVNLTGEQWLDVSCTGLILLVLGFIALVMGVSRHDSAYF